MQIALGRFPQSQSFGIIRRVRFERNDVSRPALRDFQPIRLVEEESWGENSASDNKIAPIARCSMTMTQNTRSHLFQCIGPVRIAECVPYERTRKRVRVRENSKARDVVVRCVQLKEKQFARF